MLEFLKNIRPRHNYMVLGSILIILLLILSDPDFGVIEHLSFGASTFATLLILLKTVLYVTVLHLSRKALFDYLNLEEVYKKAMETSEGASRVFQGIAIVLIALSLLIYASTHV